MKPQTIFCGICGKAEQVSLFQHICDEHNILPEEYQARCPNAPLFTPEFREYVKSNRIHVVDGTIKMVRDLFGVETTCNAIARENVPAVDERFAFDPELGKAMLSSLTENDRILLVGPTGSGKSSIIAQLAARLNWPLRRVNLHGETSVSDFLGTHKARNGEVFFQYGILPNTMREGKILVLEEIDAATPEILFVLQGVLEDGGTLTIADNAGENVIPHPDFRLVATANTLGLGDESGMYTGTSVLNASHLDRWTTVYQVGYLGTEEEAAVIMDKVPGINHALVEGFVNLATAVRKAVAEEELFMTFSTRRLLALARKSKSMGVDKALEVTVLNKLPKTDRSVVAELAQRHIPGLNRKIA